MRGYIIVIAILAVFSGCSQKQPTKVIKPTHTKKVVLPNPMIRKNQTRVQRPNQIRVQKHNPNLGEPIILKAPKPMPVIVLRQKTPLERSTQKAIVLQQQKKAIENNIQQSVKVTPPKPVEPSLNSRNSKSYVTTFKTKKFAFSDAGFLKTQGGRTDLQIFAAGKPLMKLKILPSDDICVNQLCNTKHGFNQSYLSGAYPDNLLENVLHAKPIFNSQNLKETTNGFMQRIKGSQYNIKYKIMPGMIYFKDVKNKIIIKLKALGR